MDKDKEKQEISLIGRLFSIEALIILMGLVSLGYGIVNRTEINIFWGVIILVGAVALHFVRKRDWKAHWEEQERIQRAYLEKKQREKEQQDERKG
jgi:hypothetical protein